MAKDSVSELQKAANRVREAELDREAAEIRHAEAKKQMDRAKLAHDNAIKLFERITDELYTARNDVARELEFVQKLIAN